MFPQPETLALVVPMQLEGPEDLAILEKAARSTKKYVVAAYSLQRIVNGIFPYSWLPFDLPLVRGKQIVFSSNASNGSDNILIVIAVIF